MSTNNEFPERAFVLGLDGVPWYLIERWANAGELPNFARVVEEGAAGPLQSTTPATTPLAWPSIATGTWPDKHGIYGFHHTTNDYHQRMYTSEHVRQPELWDLLSPALVGNVPMTYPAREFDGRMVTGMTTPSRDGSFTYPRSLAAEIQERIADYRIGLDWSEYTDDRERFLADLSSLVNARRELMRLFMETDDWRLFFFVYTAPDRLQHLVWEEGPMLDHYRFLDDVLGEVMDYVQAHDAALFVVSDHGFGPISKNVYLNRVLEEAGYLVAADNTGARGTLASLGVSREAVRTTLQSLGISDELLFRYLPREAIDRVADTLPGEHALFDVDHAKTKAFATSHGLLYVNDSRRFQEGVVDPADVPAVKRELSALFRDVTDPDTGERALSVSDGAELFPTDERAPDLVVVGRDGYQHARSLKDHVFEPSGKAKAASHRSEGVFLAWGPTIEPGSTPADATVVDVAPTVLHSLGEPVGEAMDGRVLQEVVRSDSAPGQRSVERVAYALDRNEPAVDTSEEDYGEVEHRLHGLGYLE